MPLTRALPALFALLAFLAAPLAAEEKQPQTRQATVSTGILSLLPPDSTTQHVLETHGGDLPYAATAGTLDLYGQDGQVSAKVFYTAYMVKEGKTDRPITFLFNGGPGAASAYLHLGLVGPRILDFGPDNDGTTAKLIDNPESWLRFTDLVFIDPVGTGWSRPASKENEPGFYGVEQDAQSLAKVISLYLRHSGRTSSPKFIVGESYGGFRAAKVAAALKDSQGILVSGAVMLSPLIESRLLFGATDYPLGAALQLPSLAAGELERRNAFDLKAIAEAEHFAMTDYMVALAGPEPRGTGAETLYSKLSKMTGIPEGDIARSRGFLGDIYTKRSSAKGDVVSPYDAGFAASDPNPELSYDRSDDPVLDGFTRAYASTFAAYARDELGYSCDVTYTLLSTEVNRAWDWGGNRGEAEATSDIRSLLSTIPSFRLMITHGYSDALTPYGASRYVLDHLPASLIRGRAELKVYRGGHMFYTRPASRSDITRDAEAFYAGRPMPLND